MYKCKICGKKYTDLSGLYNHIESKHADMIPKDMSVQQYYYYTKTGKLNGNCVMCKQPTTWNKNTNKYNRFCNNPKCKEKYAKIMKDRMIAKYGKVHLLNDPEKQREMLAKRKISGTYEWSDGKSETTYTGSYELDFLKTMDLFFEWDPEDILMPSPHTYTYRYEGEDKFYIPDVFIPSLDLEIEIKDGGDNPNNHYKIQAVDKEKEKLKDEVLKSQKNFHYVKITNKNYTNFFDFLKEIKDGFEKYGDDKKIPRIFKIEDIKTGSLVQESYDLLTDNTIINFDNYLSESTEIIGENYLFNEDDIYLNIDKFESGKKHILFITGHSGSGKSTLGKVLAKKYNAKYVELDLLTVVDHKPTIKNTIFEEYIKQKGLEDFVPQDASEEEYNQFVYNFIQWLLHERTHQKMIVEGIQVFCLCQQGEIEDYPVIIKNVSIFNSILRAKKRDYKNWLSFIKGLPKEIYWRVNDEKQFKKFKNTINENTEVIEESNGLMNAIEEGFIENILNDRKITPKRKIRDNDFFISLNYDVKKDSPKELQALISKLIKGARCEDDMKYIKELVGKSQTYYHNLLKKKPELEDEYQLYYDWINDGMRKEIKDKMKKIKESTEILEEKFEPDKFLVWFDKPIQKALGRKIKLYHGSTELVDGDVMEPISFNVGATKYSDPRWSTYFWDNKEDAMKWVTAIVVNNVYKYSIYLGHNGKTLIGKPENMTDKEAMKEIVKLASGHKFYVYEVEIDIDDLEIGSCPSIKEYTVSKPVNIVKRYNYELNPEILRRFFTITTEEEVKKWREQGKTVKDLKLHRNVILNNILDNTRDSYRGIMRTDLRQGNIKVGDDLSQYKDSINYHVKRDSYRLKESIEAIEESTKSKPSLYFLSQNNMDGKTLQPRIPDNFFTKNGYEDKTTKRVCFASSIDKCLMGLSMNCTGKEFYVHVPTGNFDVITPTKKQVPDSGITGEKWICEPVKIKCVGKIKVIGDDNKPGKKFTYGDDKEAELYGWNWEYVKESSNIIYESSISLARINQCLQNEYEAELRKYLNDYRSYYQEMLKEKPHAIPHINEDIKKAIIFIDGLANKGVENNLVQVAKSELGDIANLSKHSKPMKVNDHIVIKLNEEYKLDTLNLKLIYENPNARQVFGLNDTKTQLVLENMFIIQRDKMGNHCVISVNNDIDESKTVTECQVKFNESIDINQLIKEKMENGVTINSLHNFKDNEYKFIKEACLRLFGRYPDSIEIK